MTFDPGRSTCVIAMPRTGSTVLVDYLTRALNQQNVAELFEFSRSRIRRIRKVNSTGNFNHDYEFYLDRSPQLQNLSSHEYSQEFQREFSIRLDIIREFEQAHGPMVFKIFADKLQLDPAIDLGYLARNFNVVVLYRENVLYSLLSEFICHSLYKFHEHDHDKLPALKARLNNLRIQINEAEFLAKLKNHVFLRMIAHNIGGLTNRYAVIKFEDFEYDSFPNLNKILGYDITGEPWPNKFIENHEQHIQNLDRIKQIYQWYKPR